jgi:drug/metabolite transporter (DMT)-like permease
MDSRTARALPVLFGLGLVWGASFLFIKVWVEDTGPLELVFVRLAFGLLAVLAYLAVTRTRITADRAVLVQVSLVSIIGNIIPFGLIAWGEEHISSGTASILNAMVPIFTAVIAAAALEEERFTPPRMFGLLLGFVGVGVLTGEDALDVTSSSVLGQLAVVAAAACYGVAAVANRFLLRGRDPVSVASLQMAVGTLYAGVILMVARLGRPDFNVDPEAWASVVALGIMGTGAGIIAYLWLIETIGSVRGSLVTYIVPVVAVILGWAVLDEHIGWNTIAGGALIVAGVASVIRGAAPTREPLATPEATVAAVGD